MTKEQKLVLADRLMNIEFKHSPVTGSRNSLRIGSAVVRETGKAKKFTEEEIAGIRAFYVTDSASSTNSSLKSKPSPKSKRPRQKPGSAVAAKV